MATDEQTPLLPARKGRLASVVGVENRILLAGFLITLAFSYTQCDEFYASHPPPRLDGGDRCSRDEVAAGTARQYSFLSMSTTLCGTLNLFVAGSMVKRLGPRAALMAQTFVPAVRVATQILGVVAGRRTGMAIIQATQLITILGGPAGYILVVNIFAGEVVEPLRRTAVFGKLQGSIMLGQGIGYLIGGIIGDAIDVRAPFDVAFVSFVLAGVYARCALPYIAPEAAAGLKDERCRRRHRQGLSGFLAPQRILAPQRLRLADGRRAAHYGVVFLCCGIFVGVLAGVYARFLLHLYATAAFDFNQAANGWLMWGFAVMRSLFLILVFPRVIARGRAWVSASAPAPARRRPGADAPGYFDAAVGDAEPVPDPAVREGYLFDLVFLRWSLVVDGALTAGAAFATRPWHIYLAAFFLPFGSGSAPAAKGVITEMCSESQRADALNAVTLVENVARLATQGLFGFVFASLATVGKAYATFFCNAAIAVFGMAVLLLSSFPPAGSSLIDGGTGREDEQAVEEEPARG
ncbi:hypothetical protein CDD83_8078 [Cordyceps sp. RAO-2017]|nr:hypothetical protein CDD83_8078 [Cordyceps sp. RAO-2017]